MSLLYLGPLSPLAPLTQAKRAAIQAYRAAWLRVFPFPLSRSPHGPR